MKEPERRSDGSFIFEDYPDFRPNLSPRQIMIYGSFGGTYYRPIKSMFYQTELKDQHLKYPKSWWKDIPADHLTREWKKYDKKINKYKVKVGTTLEFWEEKGWIRKSHPYGQYQWYCDFFMGKRSHDDRRQIDRWKGIASENGRFRKWLITIILKKDGKWNDYNISPSIRQTLQHWGYELTKSDFDKEVRRRK